MTDKIQEQGQEEFKKFNLRPTSSGLVTAKQREGRASRSPTKVFPIIIDIFSGEKTVILSKDVRLIIPGKADFNFEQLFGRGSRANFNGNASTSESPVI